jgi:acetylornithine deacetylase/succinyl-diaminopimelate desuccinylase-like protein
VYPDECKALVDCRLTYGQSKAALFREIKQCLDAEKQRDKSITYSIRDITVIPPVLSEKTDPIVSCTRRAFKDVAGVNIRLGTIDGVTDGNLLHQAGIPCVVFGVQGGNIHSENEFALVQSIQLMPRVFAAVAKRYLQE